MTRTLLAAGVVGVCGGVVGCADTWDTVTSRSFRDRPFHRTFGHDDPLHTLRTNPTGGERAAAMLRLKEPAAAGGSQSDQDEVLDHILGPAATTDPSPVVRAAAIDALGRFRDERAARYLVAAYHQASGRADDGSTTATTLAGLQQASTTGPRDREPGSLNARFGLGGPTGFPAEAVAVLRAKALDGLARSGRPEGMTLLTQVATGATGDSNDRDTRMAAVRALGKVRQKESVVALAKVLSAEAGKDPAMAGRVHAELVGLTGKNLPPDPAKWDEVVQAGAAVAAEPTAVERAVSIITPGG